MEVISLLSLGVVIVLGFLTKINIGLISIAAALVLSIGGGISSDELIAGFPTGLFLNLFGMFFFFSIAQINGSLELLSKKIFNKLSNVTVLYPFIVFIVSALITLIDPGGLTAYVVFPIITMGVGAQMGYHPLLIGALTIYGANATLMTPVGVFGSSANTIAENAGYSGYSLEILLNSVGLFTFGGAILYVIFRGWRVAAPAAISGISNSQTAVQNNPLADLPAFNRKQKVTLSAMGAMVLTITFAGTHAGLTALAYGVLLLFLRCADENETFQQVPWATIFLCVGIGNLLSVIQLLGGLDLLVNLITSLTSRWTLAPMLGMTSSVMSFFTLAIAGPIPTLVAIVDSLNAAVGEAFLPIELISTVINNGFTAAISPLSLGGAMVMSAYGTLYNPNAKERSRVFSQLFIAAIVVSLIASVLPNSGIYQLFSG